MIWKRDWCCPSQRFPRPSAPLPSVLQAQPQTTIASTGFTPQQIRTAYGIDQIGFDAITGDGAGQTIAIVDAYDDPDLVDSTSPNFQNSDLALFDQRFGLPNPPSFEKLGQDGSTNLPAADPTGLWEVEEALDVEWAHAIAPAASIVLIECSSSGYESLLVGGAKTAASLPGVSVVSMSFGTSEFSSEQYFDSVFTTPSGHQGVTYVACTGDSASTVEYPASSPDVLAVGGTSLFLNADSSYHYEATWPYSGAGTSAYETEPAYQESAQSTGMRTVPDVAFDAASNTGVQVYDSYLHANPLFETSGTSLAAPCWAGLIAIADQGRVAAGGTTLAGPGQALPALYSLPGGDYHAITSNSSSSNATPNYNIISGLGSPNAELLVGDLAAYQVSQHPGTISGQPQTKLIISSLPPSSVTAGAPFKLTVIAEDASGNVVSSFNGSLRVALHSTSSGGQLGGNVTVEAVNGVATFSNLTLDTAGSGYSLTVTGSGLSPATIAGPRVLPAAASQLVIISQPSGTLTAGNPFGLAVAVEDRFGNVQTAFSGPMTVALANNPGGGILGGTLTSMVSQGVANFSGLVIDQAGTGYALQVNCQNMTTTTAPLNVIAGNATKLVVVSQPPATVQPGSKFGISVWAEDSFGNLATSYSGNLVVVITGPHGKARPGGTFGQRMYNGQASFSNLIVKTVGSGYTLILLGAGLPPVATTRFNVSLPPKRIVTPSRVQHGVASTKARTPAATVRRILKAVRGTGR